MITVAICTRQRPKLLRRLLQSCVEIEPDSRTDLQFIVIENGPKEEAETIVGSFRNKLDIRYVHAPEIGLVMARNAAINAFLEGNGDWLAFFDDDSEVDPNWLSAMLDAMQSYPVERGFAGESFRINADGSINQYHNIGPKGQHKTGKTASNVSTANIVLQRSLFEEDGENMRFHPAFNLSGGEDTQFAYELQNRKIHIIWVCEAIVREDVHDERIKNGRRIIRIITAGNNWGMIKIIHSGPMAGRLNNLLHGSVNLINSVTFGLTGLLVYPISRKTGMLLLRRSEVAALFGLGMLRSIFLPSKLVYGEVDGE